MIVVSGIVAVRDQQPYVQLKIDGNTVAQLSMGEARKVAGDIVTMCARTEADAMIHKFFREMQLPDKYASQLMHQFREYRLKLDTEPVEGKVGPDL